MGIEEISTQELVRPFKANQESQEKATKKVEYKKKVDTMSPAQKADDVYNIDLNLTMNRTTGPKQVATDYGCTQTQTCSTCGCAQTSSGCHQTQQGC